MQEERMNKCTLYSVVAALGLCLGCGGEKKDSYSRAVEAWMAGRNAEAIELFKRSLKERPENARAHNYLGMVYRRTGEQKSAQREFEESIRIDPSFGSAFYNFGALYQEREMFEEAREKYIRAVDLAPDLIQAHNSLGVVSTRLGKYEEAVNAFERALELNPEYESACFSLGRVYAANLGEKQKAKEHLRAYLKMAPGGEKAARAQEILKELGEESPAGFYNHGVELCASGHFAKALEQFDKALEVDRKFAPAMLEAAKIHDFRLDDKEKAVQYYERYLETNLKADDASEVMSLLAAARNGLKPIAEETEEGEVIPPSPTPTPRAPEVLAEGWEEIRGKALALQQSGDHFSAIDEFEKAAALNPELDLSRELAGSYHEIGIEHMRRGESEVASGFFQKALLLAPTSGETEYQLGMAYSAQRSYREALESFERASSHGVTRIGKDVAAVHAAMGEEHLKAGRHQEAVGCYERALERNPSNAQLHFKMAGILREGNYYKRALGEYRKALDIDPNYSEAHAEAATLLERSLNDREGAILHYKRYIQLAPNGPHAEEASVAIERMGKAVDELRKYRKVVEKDPLRAEAHYNLAVMLQERGMFDEAMEEYKSTIRLKPDFDRAYFNLGAVYMRRGYYDRATQMYQKATELNPRYAKAHNNLGVLYSKRGRQKEALSSYEKALTIDPGFASAHFNIALLYKNLGKKEKALYHYKKYIEYAPDGAYADQVRGILRKEGGVER